MYLVMFVDLCRSLNMPRLCVFVLVSKLQPSQPLLRIYTGDKAA